jgi:hypothetical protein
MRARLLHRQAEQYAQETAMRINHWLAGLCFAQACAVSAQTVQPLPVEAMPSSGGLGRTGSGAAMPSDLPVKPLSPPAPASDLSPKTENGVTTLCGGIGSDEAEWMKREARGYDLMLTFASRDGAYLANVNVGIADAQGKAVLKTNCDAPILLVNLPDPGNYLITAETGGNTVSRRTAVAGSAQPRQLTLTWPSQVAGATPAPTAAPPADSTHAPR